MNQSAPWPAWLDVLLARFIAEERKWFGDFRSDNLPLEGFRKAIREAFDHEWYEAFRTGSDRARQDMLNPAKRGDRKRLSLAFLRLSKALWPYRRVRSSSIRGGSSGLCGRGR